MEHKFNKLTKDTFNKQIKSMLFNINSEETVFESNPHLTSMAAFRSITDEQFRFVAFYADWKSPYRNLPDLQRKEAAMTDAGLKSDKGCDAYIMAYYEMQGIANERESVGALDAALNEIRKRLRDSAKLESDEFKKLSDSLVALTKQRKLISDLINDKLNIEDMQMTTDDGASTIDNYGG